MPITRAAVESTLVNMCGGILTKAGLDGTTVDGSNASLTSPIRQALASLGFATATLGVVVEADLLPITWETLDQLLEVAELRALESALGNLNQPDQMADTDNQQWLGKLRESIEDTVARKRKQVERQYGYGLSSLVPGVVDLGFAETFDSGNWRPT